MSKNQPTTLNAAEFTCAKTRAAELLAAIKRKYPTLKPRAVLTIPPDQCDLDAPPETILRECPAILSNNLAKSELKHLPPLSKQEASVEREQRANQIREISAGLLYRGDALVELRFGHLDYPKIRELQTDELVDQTRTPVSGASIRIVLGNMQRFATNSPILLPDSKTP